MSKKFGRYELIERISFGGMAEVYLGKSGGIEGFEKVMAIKRMLPNLTEDADFVTMFIDEARISAQLTHNNIGQVFEFGKCDDHYFIAMEYIQGLDLRTVHKVFFNSAQPMPVNVVLRMIRDVCNGLDYAHSKLDAAGNPMNIVHRDISPQNIIVSYDGAVKVIDFGIAKALDRATQTQGGQIKGKFGYMSPEHAEGGKVDGRSDLFSLGILTFELLTNKPLFQGNTAINTLQNVLKAIVPPIPDLNPMVDDALEAIIRKALARSPDDRFQSAEEMQSALEEYVVAARHSFSNKQLSNWMKETFAAKFKQANELLSKAASVTPAPVTAEEDLQPSASVPGKPQDTSGERHTSLSPDILAELESINNPVVDQSAMPPDDPPPDPILAEDAAALVADMMPATSEIDDEPTVLDSDKNAALLAQLMAANAGDGAADLAAETSGADLGEDGDLSSTRPQDPPPAVKEHEQEAAPAPEEPHAEPETQAPPVVQEPSSPRSIKPEPARMPGEIQEAGKNKTGGGGKFAALLFVLILLLGAGGGVAYWVLAGPGSGGGEAAREPVPEPVKEPAAESDKVSVPEPAPEPPPEPVVKEPVPEPVVKEPVPEPVKEPVPEPVKKATADPVKNHAAAPARPRRARKPGYLVVVTPKQSKIVVDGKDTGRKTPVAPSNPLSLGPGRHKVRLEAEGKSTEYRVVIKSGETAKLVVR